MKRKLTLFLVALCLLLTGCGGSDQEENEIKTPLSSKDCGGMQYQEVADAFSNAGFTDIETVAIEDLVFGWLTEDGEVESVTVDGDDSFSAGERCVPESAVVITYHTFPSEESTAEDTMQAGSDTGLGDTAPDSDAAPPDAIDSDSATVPPDGSTFSIHFIDVGQADAALVECDGRYMLIDGGNKADSNVMYSVLKSAGASHLELVIGTHAHEDHIGGLPGAFNYATANTTLCPVTSYESDAFEDFARYAEEKGGGITVPSTGDRYDLGSAAVTILGVGGGSEPNDTSIILKIQYGETSFLFTGDAERDAEQAVLSTGFDLSATVLKVGHHGSDTSTTYPFLREIMPQYAVISVGEDNSYGHPTENTLSRLRDADVEVYRTDLHGDIYLTSDGSTVSITTDKTPSGDVLAPGGGSAAVTPPMVVPEPEPEPDPEPEPEPAPEPVGTDYIININTGKFHYPACHSVDRMKESNKRFYTGTRDELVAQGYSPCGNCDP